MRHNGPRHVFSWLSCLVLLPCLLGCWPSGPKRVIVSGTVKFAGTPIERGVISFEAIDGPTSRVGAKIENGTYRADADGGVPAGMNRVLIMAFDGGPTPPPAKLKPESTHTTIRGTPHHQFLPAKYNTNTELKADVPSNGRTATIDYDLTP
jgi:hypothetical protein